MNAASEPLAIRVRDLVVGFGDQVVLDHLSLDVRRGEILGVVGASGGGKSVLLRTIIGLIPKRQGTIEVLGIDLGDASEEQMALDRAPVRHPLPAGRAVLVAHGAPERAVPDARVSRLFPSACAATWRWPSSKWSG